MAISNREATITGYADVIGEALKTLEIEMAPPGTKNMMRYGLLYLNNETKSYDDTHDNPVR